MFCTPTVLYCGYIIFSRVLFSSSDLFVYLSQESENVEITRCIIIIFVFYL